MIQTSLVAITLCALATGLPAQQKKKQIQKHVIRSAEASVQRIETAIRDRIRKPDGELTAPDFERIKHLSLAGMGLTDIAPLAKLTKIRSLNLDYNEISDLTPLAGLVELEKLHLGSNQITDLSPLKNLKKLEFIPLFRNQISDLSPIANWSQAEHLALYCNPVSDLRPLHGLAKLRKVKLQGNPVSPKSLAAARKAQPFYGETSKPVHRTHHQPF